MTCANALKCEIFFFRTRMESSDVPDDRLTERGRQDTCLRRQSKQDAEGKLVFSRSQAAHLLGESSGKHGIGPLHQVDRRGSFAGLAVQRRVRLDKVRHVGNVHAHLEGAVVLASDVESIIQVLGRAGVDCKDSSFPQILANLKLALGDGEGQGRQTFSDRFVEVFDGEVAVLHESAGLGLKVSNGAQLLAQRAEGMQRSDGPAYEA